MHSRLNCRQITCRVRSIQRRGCPRASAALVPVHNIIINLPLETLAIYCHIMAGCSDCMDHPCVSAAIGNFACWGVER